MARPKADDFDVKHQLILNIAADLFAQKGYPVTTTIDIAEACGMSKSLLYHYHRSKEAILHALLLNHLQEVIAYVDDALLGIDDPRDRLRAFLVALLECNAKSRNKNVVLLNETDSLPETQRAEIRRLEQRLVRVGATCLAALNPAVMDQRRLRPAYTMFLFGTVNWTYTWYDPKGSMKPQEIADRILTLFLDGFLNV